MPILGILASAISGHLGPVFDSDYESISTVSVGSGGTSSISFSSIPSTYKHLQLRCSYRVNTGATEIGGFRVNGNTSGIYYAHKLEGDGATASAAFRSNANTSAKIGVANNALSDSFSVIVLDLLDYLNTNKNKTWRSLYGTEVNGSGGTIGLFSGYAATTTAISSLSLFPETGVDFVQYSQFALYGVKG
jgi:hypothetical protein